MSLGIDALDAPGATGSYDSDFASKAAVVRGGMHACAAHLAWVLRHACTPLCCTAVAWRQRLPRSAAVAAGPTPRMHAAPAMQACEALISGGYDFALLHVKAVDDTGHDRMVAMKVGHITRKGQREKLLRSGRGFTDWVAVSACHLIKRPDVAQSHAPPCAR